MPEEQTGQQDTTPRPAAEMSVEDLLNEQIDALRQRQVSCSGDAVAIADAIVRLAVSRAMKDT